MPHSFWIFLIVCVASFVTVINDHRDAWEEFKTKTGLEKFWKGLHIFALWFICVLSLIGTIVLGYESLQDDKKEKIRETQFNDVTNHEAKLEAEIQPRRIKPFEREHFIEVLNNTNVAKFHIKVLIGAFDQETMNFAVDFRQMLNDAGYGSNNEHVIQINPAAFTIRPFQNDESVPQVMALCWSTNRDTSPLENSPGTVVVIYPTANSPSGWHMEVPRTQTNTNILHGYLRGGGPNDVLRGVCNVLDEIGINTGYCSGNDVLEPGEIGFFIPQRNF
jgi:hypothetical protein